MLQYIYVYIFPLCLSWFMLFQITGHHLLSEHFLMFLNTRTVAFTILSLALESTSLKKWRIHHHHDFLCFKSALPSLSLSYIMCISESLFLLMLISERFLTLFGNFCTVTDSIMVIHVEYAGLSWGDSSNGSMVWETCHLWRSRKTPLSGEYFWQPWSSDGKYFLLYYSYCLGVKICLVSAGNAVRLV